MQTRLIVPGLKEANKRWVDGLASSLDDTWACLGYPWWEDSGIDINPDLVLAHMAKAKPDFVVAKSIGTLFTSMALNIDLISPSHVVFLGVPMKAVSEKEYSEILNAIIGSKSTFLLIPHSNDFLGGFREVKETLSEASLYLVEISGCDHLYDEYMLFSKIINDWVSSSVNNHRQLTR